MENAINLKGNKGKNDFLLSKFTLNTSEEIFSKHFLRTKDQLRIIKKNNDEEIIIDINLKLYNDSKLLISDINTFLLYSGIIFVALTCIFMCIWCTSSNRFSVPIFSLPLTAAIPFYMACTVFRILSPDIETGKVLINEPVVRIIIPSLLAIPSFLLCFKQKKPRNVHFSKKTIRKFKEKFKNKKKKGKI